VSIRTTCRLAGLAAATITCVPSLGHAQGTADVPAEEAASARIVVAAPAEGIRIDGSLDEAAWAAAIPTTGFTQTEPNEGEPSSHPAEVRVLRGGDALYVGAHLFDSNPAAIRRPLGRRDAIGQADLFLLALDALNDRRTAYVFAVSAGGVLYDAVSQGNDDDSWNAVWDGVARIVNDGWVVEMRIPYSQLRFAEGVDSWAINFSRQIPRNDEQSFWAPFTQAQAQSGIVQYFGRLEGVGGLRPRRVVQATPYALTRARRFEDDALPGQADASYSLDGGADLKLGLASNLILDLAVNPDFGQIEADPAELNLSTFETFFDERRPFFLEGTQIFNLRVGNDDGALLYTRRIGAASRLLGAAKLSGQSAGGLSFGALAATTGRDADPDRTYGALRMRRQLGGQNYIGAGVSGFDFAPNDSAETPIRSIAGATDWDIRMGGDEEWKLDGSLAGTTRQVAGEDVRRGYALYVGFDRVKGWFTPGSGLRFYSPGFELNDVGRFRQNDVIQARLGGNYIFNRGRPVGPFRRLNLGAFGTHTWRYADGTNRGLEVFGFGGGQLQNFHELNIEFGTTGVGGLDVRETRGLGPVVNVAEAHVSINYGTDQRRQLRLYPGFYVGVAEDGATDFTPYGTLEWTANDRLNLSFNGFLEIRDGWRAWAANEGLIRTSEGLFIGAEAAAPDDLDPSALELLPMSSGEIDELLQGITPFAGTVPVEGGVGYHLPTFATRDTRQLRLTARATWLFSTDISLQLYANALAARGRLDEWRLLAGEDDLRDFGAYPKRRDFAHQTFNANAVLRWEYRPGSTLFVVFTQARGDNLEEELLLDPLSTPPRSPFQTTTAAQLGDTFRLFPDNVILVKLNYLLMR
jgi:hypothetical protein